MKRMWVIILSLFLTSTLFSQTTLTLDEAIKIALQGNSNLIKGQNALSVDKANIKSAYGDLLPDLGVRGSWGWNRVIDAGGQQLNYLGEQVNTPASESDTRNYSLSAGGNITLFDGLANYARISRANNDLESSEYDLYKLKQDLVYTTTLY